MEVLKGAVNTLIQDIKYIIVEINKKELYEGCPNVKDIDVFLKIWIYSYRYSLLAGLIFMGRWFLYKKRTC